MECAFVIRSLNSIQYDSLFVYIYNLFQNLLSGILTYELTLIALPHRLIRSHGHYFYREQRI